MAESRFSPALRAWRPVTWFRAGGSRRHALCSPILHGRAATNYWLIGNIEPARGAGLTDTSPLEALALAALWTDQASTAPPPLRRRALAQADALLARVQRDLAGALCAAPKLQKRSAVAGVSRAWLSSKSCRDPTPTGRSPAYSSNKW
jgi:hypothetical protein